MYLIYFLSCLLGCSNVDAYAMLLQLVLPVFFENELFLRDAKIVAIC